MSELNALVQKLAALTSGDDVFVGGARVISTGGHPAPLSAILAEIDNTILERDLEIKSDGSTANLIASGRRLRGIYAVTPSSDDAVIGQIISREEPELTQAAAQLLTRLFGDADQLTVRSLPPEPFGKGGERGISARGLAELWEIQVDEAPKPPMENFLQANSNIIVSLMHVSNDEISSTVGNFETLQTIWKTQVSELRAQHENALSGEDGPKLICLEGALEDGTSAALALIDDELALFAYQTDKLGVLHASWRKIFG